jgi:hypothetical protein
MNKLYFQQLQATLESVIRTLTDKGIEKGRLTFGGAGPLPLRKPTVPIDARSEFLANRAMGDWAEKMLTTALQDAFPKLTVAQYGNTTRISAPRWLKPSLMQPCPRPQTHDSVAKERLVDHSGGQ